MKSADNSFDKHRSGSTITREPGYLKDKRVFLDALRVKIRDADSRQVKTKAVYVALGVTPEGEREVLGLWIAANEGAKFWLSIMNDRRNRGEEDILIAVVDGRKGFPGGGVRDDLWHPGAERLHANALCQHLVGG